MVRPLGIAKPLGFESTPCSVKWAAEELGVNNCLIKCLSQLDEKFCSNTLYPKGEKSALRTRSKFSSNEIVK